MQSIAIQIALLQRRTLPELQKMWGDYFTEPTISQNKEFFVSRIAYRIQEMAYGGLPRAQQKLIAQMYIPPEARRNLPPVGTRIIREYNGMKFPTLSAIAKKITGKKISGRHFFGIDK